MRRIIALFVLATLVIASQAYPSTTARAAAPVDQAVWRSLDTSPTGRANVILLLREQADLAFAERVTDHVTRKMQVMDALRETASRSQAPILTLLRDYKRSGDVSRYGSFIAANAVSVEATRQAVQVLAVHPGVARIEANVTVTLDTPRPGASLASVDTVEWNVVKVRAPEVWARGITGEGVTVGSIDTGIDHKHPALVDHYKCKPEGPHEKCWADMTGANSSTTPIDENGHGTHTIGTIVGGDGPGPFEKDIGVAPGVKRGVSGGGVIVCRAFAGPETTAEVLLKCMDWMLAPGGNPANAPDVVNNSWGALDTSEVLRSAVKAWVAAGIFPVFANGNAGPACRTVMIPASYPESFGVGATDMSDDIAFFSGRGPSFFRVIRPNVSAPGVNVTSSFMEGAYLSLSGTSMAAPHVAGEVALLLDKNPKLSINHLKILISATTIGRSDRTCGGRRPNNTYGWGRIDTMRAVRLTPAPRERDLYSSP